MQILLQAFVSERDRYRVSKQLNIFSTQDDSKKSIISWSLYIDGASKNNPGPSGAGVFISKNDEAYKKKSFNLGIKTNNQAEYLALVLGVYLVSQEIQDNDKLQIISDSELLVRQLKGVYKIRDAELKKLYAVAMDLLEGVHFSVKHVLRDKNTIADDLAKSGTTSKNKIPHHLIEILERHEFKI